MLISVPLLQFCGLWTHPTPINAFCVSASLRSRLFFTTYGLNTSSINFKVSCSLDQCWEFCEIQNPLGNLKPRGWEAVVFPAYMIWKGRNSPERKTNVKVMFRLSVKPLMETDFCPLLAIVDFPTDTYEQGVWYAFSTRSGGILYFRTLSCISHKYSRQHSLYNPCGTGGRPVVPILFENPKRL